MTRSSRAISEYGIERGYNFTYVRDRNRLEVLTRYQDLVDMTDSFSDAGFIDRFGFTGGNRAIVGIGSGSGWFQAKLNATRATEIVRPGDGQIFYVSDEKVLGPLGRDSIYVDRAPSQQLIQLAEALKLSHTDLQRIITYVKLTGSRIVSAAEIAEHLGINLRSSYRLLQKVLEGGGAVSFTEKSSRGRGRPKRLYDLTFTDTLI